MTKVQKVTPFVALLVVVLAVGWVLLPFDFAKGVQCGAPLFGGHPKSEVSVGLIIPKEDCPDKARSRLLTAAMISLVAVIASAAAVALQPLSPACFSGNHDGCHEGWANLLSDSFEGFGCQCDCHRGGL